MKLEDKVEEALELAANAYERYANCYPIDEVSIFFKSEETLALFEKTAMDYYEWERFNAVQDTVFYTHSGIHMSFGVEYVFLRHPFMPYRIEAMRIVSGGNFIHGELGDFSIAHSSYKVNGLDNYNELKGYMPVKGEFCNSYGRFFYVDDGYAPFLKARVNLRDK